MLLVGLTGGIGAGKSLVSALLEKRGAKLIDVDLIARAVVLPGTPAWYKLREHFGPQFFFADGMLNRAAVAEVAFSDPLQLRTLNEITHPAMMKRLADQLEELAGEPGIVVLDAALLIEAGLADMVDVVVVVDTTPELQLERLAALGMDDRQARARMAAQLDRSVRRARADLVIDNTGPLEDLGHRVDELWEQLRMRLDNADEGATER